MDGQIEDIHTLVRVRTLLADRTFGCGLDFEPTRHGECNRNREIFYNKQNMSKIGGPAGGAA